MTKQEILKELERIKDSLSDQDNRWGIEGVLDDISNLMFEINVNTKEF